MRINTARRSDIGAVTVLGLLACPLAGGTHAAEPSTQRAALSPIPQRSWQVSAGSIANFQKIEEKYTLYYLVQYKGKSLLKQGVAPTLANVAAVPDFVTAKKNGEGDTNDLVFRLEHGNAALTGGIFDALLTKPLPIPALQGVRGVLQISGQPTGRRVNYAAGLETRLPSPFLLFNAGPSGGANLVNWLFLGLSAENRNMDTSGGSTPSSGTSRDVGLATYRTFVGRGFQPVALASDVRDYDQKRNAAKAAILKATEEPDPATHRGKYRFALFNAEAERLIAKEKASQPLLSWETLELGLLQNVDVTATPEQRTVQLQAQYGDAVVDTPTWEARVSSAADNFSKPVANRPKLAVWVDSAGWYEFTGKADGHGSRFRNLLSGNVQYFFNPGEGEGSFLLLRYENGQERAAPTVYNNFLSLSTGFSF